MTVTKSSQDNSAPVSTSLVGAVLLKMLPGYSNRHHRAVLVDHCPLSLETVPVRPIFPRRSRRGQKGSVMQNEDDRTSRTPGLTRHTAWHGNQTQSVKG